MSDDTTPAHTNANPRDFIGYGPKPPHMSWPDGVKLAINLVLNYEEALNIPGWRMAATTIGANTISPTARRCAISVRRRISNMAAAPSVWRLARLFDRYKIPVTSFRLRRGAGAQSCRRRVDECARSRPAGPRLTLE